MIRAICADCKKVFLAAVILGNVKCPKCGSDKICLVVERRR